jgi:aminoglycoside 2''-phosphotransferase
MDHLTLILDNTWVFRFPKNPEYIALFPKELSILEALQEHIDLPIPHYSLVPVDKSFGGYQKIQGRQLSRTGFKCLSSKVKNKIAVELGSFLNQLHAFPIQRAKKLGVATGTPYDYFLTIEKEYATHVRGKITRTEQEYCRTLFTGMKTYLKEKHPTVMSHNDLHPMHILLGKSKRVAGIIDFGDKVIGDPARDFCGLLDIDPFLMNAVYRLYHKKDSTFLNRTLLLRKLGSVSWLVHNAKTGTPKSYSRAYRQFKRMMGLELN